MSVLRTRRQQRTTGVSSSSSSPVPPPPPPTASPLAKNAGTSLLRKTNSGESCAKTRPCGRTRVASRLLLLLLLLCLFAHSGGDDEAERLCHRSCCIYCALPSLCRHPLPTLLSHSPSMVHFNTAHVFFFFFLLLPGGSAQQKAPFKIRSASFFGGVVGLLFDSLLHRQ